MRTLLKATGLAAALAASGCTYLTATPSVAGHAYVVRVAMGASSFWNCDATSGEPTCYETKKEPLAAAAAK